MKAETEKAWFSWIPAMPPPAVLLITLLFDLRFLQQAAAKHWEPPPYWRETLELLNPETLIAAGQTLADLVFLTKDLILSLLTAELETLLTVNHYFPDSMGILALTLLNLEVIYMFMTMKYNRKKNEESEARGKAQGRAEVEAETREWFAKAQAQYPDLPPPPFLDNPKNSS